MVIHADIIDHEDNMAKLQQALNAQPAYAIVEPAPKRSENYIDLDNPVIITGANDNSSDADDTTLLAHNNHGHRYRGHNNRGYTACITIDFITICDGDGRNNRRGHGHGHGHGHYDNYWHFRGHDNDWHGHGKKKHKHKHKKKKHRNKHNDGHRGGKKGGRNRHSSLLGDQFEGQAAEVVAKNEESTNTKQNILSAVMTTAAINPKDITTKVSFNNGEKINVDASDFILTDFDNGHHDDVEPEELAVG